MRCTKALIHSETLKQNFLNIKKAAGSALVCTCLKANAYGHGLIGTAKLLSELQCDYFGLATTNEAKILRDKGIKTHIILLSLITPEEIPLLIDYKLEPMVSRLDFIKLIENEAKKQSTTVNLHLKVDTGMGRIGCNPQCALELAEYIDSSPYLNLKGLGTHFSTSELPDQTYTNRQLDIFNQVIEELKDRGIRPEIIHAANSGALIMNRNTLFNMVRTGINLYGYPPNREEGEKLQLKPVMEIVSKVVELKKVPKGTDISYGRTFTTSKESIIATIPIGYADGYSRHLSNKGQVWIKGRCYPVLGRVCMDQIMVEVDENISLYDDVILLGREEGQPTAEDIAEITETISYEVLTNIHRIETYYL